MEENWQEGKSLIDCQQILFAQKAYSDVTFIFPNEQSKTIKAHKYVLVARSPVFERMFFGSMPETGDVSIKDISSESFNQLLRFMYYDDVELSAATVIEILYGANKYMLTHLVEVCAVYLESHLSEDTVCTLLEQSRIFHDDAQMERCLDYVKLNLYMVTNSDDFLELSRDTLQLILDLDPLYLSECEIFLACMKWAEHKAEKNGGKVSDPACIREVLGACLYKIRFPQMLLDEFANKVVPTRILSDGEEIIIYRYLTCSRQKPQEEDIPFSTKNRRGDFHEDYKRFNKSLFLSDW